MSITENPVIGASHAELLGRDEINDIEAILSVVNTDVDEVTHVRFQHHRDGRRN